MVFHRKNLAKKAEDATWKKRFAFFPVRISGDKKSDFVAYVWLSFYEYREYAGAIRDTLVREFRIDDSDEIYKIEGVC